MNHETAHAFGAPITPKIRERFEIKISPEPNTGCWFWTGALDTAGYGNFWHGGKSRKATRFAYQMWVGPIPEGLDLMHSCDMRCCVNPDHLTPGTTLENVRDMWAKGRAHISYGASNGNSSLTWDGVSYIKGMAAAGYEYSAIARQVGISRSMVGRIMSGKAWVRR